jgi:branched-chain amino acid transport system ATP-binding protein
VHFDGDDITGLPPHRVAARGIVRTFQLVRLFEDMSVAGNVAVGCHLHSRGGIGAALLRPPWVRRQERDIAEQCRDSLELVGLAAAAERPAGQLTYGHQRLLEIARAVAARPRLLLLDEPAAGLNASETAVLVMRIAADIMVLDFGRKIAEGSPADIAKNPAVLAAYLGTAETEVA